MRPKEKELCKRFRRVLRESDYLETYFGKKKHVGLICARLVQCIRDVEREAIVESGVEIVSQISESDEGVEDERYI